MGKRISIRRVIKPLCVYRWSTNLESLAEHSTGVIYTHRYIIEIMKQKRRCHDYKVLCLQYSNLASCVICQRTQKYEVYCHEYRSRKYWNVNTTIAMSPILFIMSSLMICCITAGDDDGDQNNERKCLNNNE